MTYIVHMKQMGIVGRFRSLKKALEVVDELKEQGVYLDHIFDTNRMERITKKQAIKRVKENKNRTWKPRLIQAGAPGLGKR